MTRSRSELIRENMLLRQQLIVLQRQGKRPKLTWRERITLVFLASWVGERWQEALMLVQPETSLRWQRDMYRIVWRQRSKAKGNGGRPRLSLEMVRVWANSKVDDVAAFFDKVGAKGNWITRKSPQYSRNAAYPWPWGHSVSCLRYHNILLIPEYGPYVLACCSSIR
jgi:hypothetical protein